MKQIEYNLLEERWVRVRGQDYTVQEVSLPDALLHAHEYRDLAGELPTQDGGCCWRFCTRCFPGWMETVRRPPLRKRTMP